MTPSQHRDMLLREVSMTEGTSVRTHWWRRFHLLTGQQKDTEWREHGGREAGGLLPGPAPVPACRVHLTCLGLCFPTSQAQQCGDRGEEEGLLGAQGAPGTRPGIYHPTPGRRHQQTSCKIREGKGSTGHTGSQARALAKASPLGHPSIFHQPQGAGGKPPIPPRKHLCFFKGGTEGHGGGWTKGTGGQKGRPPSQDQGPNPPQGLQQVPCPLWASVSPSVH